MIKFFSEYRIFAAILLPIIVVGYLFINWTFPYYEITELTNFGLFGSLMIPNIAAKTALAGFIILVNGLLLNLIFNNQNVFEKTIFFPAFVYIVWMSFFEEMYNFSGFLLAHTCFILMILQVFHLNQNEDGRRYVFNAALFGGLAACLHPIMVVNLPFLFIMVWIQRPFILRESLLLIAGFCTPALFALTSMLVFNNWYEFSISIKAITLSDKSYDLIAIGILCILFLMLNLYGVRLKLKNSSIRFRKLTRILYILLLSTLVVGLLDLLLNQRAEYFNILFVVMCLFSVFSFNKQPLAKISTIFFGLVILSSLLKFFL